MRAKIEKKKPRPQRIGAAHFPRRAPRRLAPVAREDVRAAPRRSPGARRGARRARGAAPPARAFQLFPRESASPSGRVVVVLILDPAGGVVPRTRARARPTTRTRARRSTAGASPSVRAGASARPPRSAVPDRALRRAKEGWRGATTRASAAEASENKKPGGADADADACADAAHAERHFADVVDALGDLERELFLAAPREELFQRRGPRDTNPRSPPRSDSRGATSSPPSTSPSRASPARREERRPAPKKRHPPASQARSPRSTDPAMDVRETPDAFVFVADVPGTKREDVEVEVDEDDRTLTVRGRREETVVARTKPRRRRKKRRTKKRTPTPRRRPRPPRRRPPTRGTLGPVIWFASDTSQSFVESARASPKRRARRNQSRDGGGGLDGDVPKRKGEEPGRRLGACRSKRARGERTRAKRKRKETKRGGERDATRRDTRTRRRDGETTCRGGDKTTFQRRGNAE